MREQQNNEEPPKMVDVGSILNSHAITKSRIAFIISAKGEISCLRDVGSNLHKMALASVLQNEADALRQEAVKESGLALVKAA